MPVWEWILIAACVVIVVAAVIVTASFVRSRKKTARMKQYYGREYERLVSETGDQKAAEKELTARERKRGNLDIVPLTPSARSDFATRWHQVQTGFVDNPATAVGVADRLGRSSPWCGANCRVELGFCVGVLPTGSRGGGRR